MRVKKISNEVCIADERIVQVGRREVDMLKQTVASSPRGRTRLCAHKQDSDALHEMLIVLTRTSYIRPHKHFHKSESFHMVEGLLDVVIFDDAGGIVDVIQMGDYDSGRQFYYRLADPLFHTLLIRSELAIFHETTNGPFRREDTVFAPWSTDENDFGEAEEYMKTLSASIARFLSERHADPQTS